MSEQSGRPPSQVTLESTIFVVKEVSVNYKKFFRRVLAPGHHGIKLSPGAEAIDFQDYLAEPACRGCPKSWRTFWSISGRPTYIEPFRDILVV